MVPRPGAGGRVVEPLTESELRSVLAELADHLRSRGETARIYIAGGAAMALAYDSEKLTRDIDASIIEGHGPVMEGVRDIARARKWPSTWLNEQATPYMPTVPDRHGNTVFDHPALKVVAASPEHMLAMKVRAARSSDATDARRLLARTGLSGAKQVEALLESVFPGEHLGERQRRWLEDLLDDTPNLAT